MNGKIKKVKKTKGLSFWFFSLSVLILSISAVWTGYLGQQTLGFAKENSLITIKNPLFKDYLIELGVEYSNKALPVAPSANDELPKTIPLGNPIAAAKEKIIQNEKLNTQVDETAEVLLQKIFNDLREFENKRAETILKKISPLVAEVKKGSIGEGWGFKSGDQIKMIGTEPVHSVWDYYQMTDVATPQKFSFSLVRGKKQIQIPLAAAGEEFSVNDVGILFLIPNSISYISKYDAIKLSNQFEDQFVKVVGDSLKKDYVFSLSRFTSGLVAMGFKQNFDLNKFEKINTAGMLGWHHEKYLNHIDEFHGALRENFENQEAVMKAFQQALIGFMAAFLLCAVAFVIRLRFISTQHLES